MSDTPEITRDDDDSDEDEPGYNDQDNDWSLGERIP